MKHQTPFALAVGRSRCAAAAALVPDNTSRQGSHRGRHRRQFTVHAGCVVSDRGLKHHVQTYNRNNARLQAGMLFLVTIALLIPSILAETDPSPAGYY